jgi:hypothetical protein
MRNIARLPPNDRRDLFRAAAQQMRVNEAIVEKDFWVCWTLDYLFHESPWQDKLAFKGGTSLSKAYGVIERFSEDIDLILDWTLLGYEKDTPWKQDSKTQRALFCEQANDRCVAFLAGTFVPQVLKDLTRRTGPAINVIPNGQEVLIEYPRAFSAAAILPQIKLEIGPIAEWFPQEPRSITPYAAEQYPDKFASRSTQIPTITAERTFWEKITILHQEAHRAITRPQPPRYSRHYYDVYRMCATPIKDNALQDMALLTDVVRFKTNFYHCAWASYDTAVPGTLRLLPPKHNKATLAADYRAMEAMLFGEIPSFDDIVTRLSDLELALNALPRPSTLMHPFAAT